MAIAEKTIELQGFNWFYREAEPQGDRGKSPVLLLHGLPSQSYTWGAVLEVLAEQGFRGIAPDWLGFGNSDKPDPKQFAYTPEAFLAGFTALIDALELTKFSLVVQGFLSTVGLQYVLKYPDRCDRLAILNAPIVPDMKLPWNLQQITFPFAGEMLTQDPLLVERVLEAGSRYAIEEDELRVYRRPFLKNRKAGFALLETTRRLNLKKVTSEILLGFQTWQRPTLVLWGEIDPWLPVEAAEAFCKKLDNGRFSKLAEAGHFPQEHWSEDIGQSLSAFLRSQEV